MKSKFTLFAATTMVCATLTVNAQTPARQKAMKHAVASLKASFLQHNKQTRKALKAADNQNMKWTAGATYSYEDGQWTKTVDNKQEYNALGLPTVTYYINATASKMASRYTYKYDTQDPTLLVEAMFAVGNYGQDNWENTRVEDKRDLTRNKDNQIEEVVVYDDSSSPWSLKKDMSDQLYYNADGSLDKIIETIHDEEDGDITITYTDFVWDRTNKKYYYAIDEDKYYEGENRIKSMKGSVTQSGMTIKAEVNVNYDEQGGYTAALKGMYMGMTVSTYTIKKTYTDANGSYVLTEHDQSMGEEDEYDKTTCTYDEHKNLVAEEEKSGNDENYMNDDGKQKIDYEYDEAGLVKTAVYYQFDYESNTYEPYKKLEYTEYKDVTAGISSAVAAPAAADTRVYSIDGTYMGNAVEGLNHGIYVVKQGNKTVKIAR